MKADAYGHGDVLVAKELEKVGIDAFCVACVQEGVKLRTQGIKGMILILGYTHPSQFFLIEKYHLTQTVVDYSYACQLNDYGKLMHVHIRVDTGMHRIGVRSEQLEQILDIYRMEHLAVDGLFTHLCVSDTMNVRGKIIRLRRQKLLPSGQTDERAWIRMLGDTHTGKLWSIELSKTARRLCESWDCFVRRAEYERRYGSMEQ